MTLAHGAGKGSEETSPLFENGGGRSAAKPAAAAGPSVSGHSGGRRKSSKSTRPHEISLTVREEGGWMTSFTKETNCANR